MGKKQILTCPSWTFNPILLGTNGTIAAGTFTGQYRISNNVTISGNVNLLNAEVLIDPQVTITVLAGGVLRIDHSHLFGCTNKWDRIWVKDGGQIFVANNTLIEDAYIAIYTTFVPSATNVPPAVIDARNSMFNKNAYGIFISQFYNNSGNYPFTITNCVFTSRKLPSLLLSGLTTNVLKTLSNTGVLEPPYINNSLYQPTFPLGSSIYPNSGITLQHIGTTTNVNLASPNNTPVYHELEIGSGIAQEFNLFDNLQVGIDMLNTNLTCHNAVFQNTVVQGGIGIRANALKDRNTRCRLIPAMNGTNPINGTHNRFYNCKRGIESKDYFEMQVERASFRSMQVSNPAASSLIGDFGYRGTSNRFHLYNINQDTFYNIGNPVAFFGTQNNTPFTGTAITQYSGDINVNENFIRPHPVVGSITTQYVSTAINLVNVFSINTVGITLAGNKLIATIGNQIAEVYRGINIENWTERPAIIRTNDISLRQQPTSLGADIPLQYGIRFVKNTANPAALGNIRLIVDNDILGFGFNFPNTYGIINSGNTDLELRCNHTNNTERGIQFINTLSTPTTFISNTMEKHHWGYTLENNCIIGTQGNPANPSDNQWLGAWVAPNFMTYVVNSVSPLSPLHIRTTPTSYNPNGFGSSVSGLTYALGNTNLLVVASPPSPAACPPSSVAPVSSPIVLYEHIARASLPYYGNTQVAQFMAEYDLYQLLTNAPQWRDSSAIVDSFYLQHQSLLYGQMTAIEQSLSQADWQTAQTLIDNFNPASMVENNYKNYYQSYLTLQTDSLGLTNEEDEFLYSLATTCVTEGGKVTILAQALYNLYHDTLVVFSDTCSMSGQENRIIKTTIPLFSLAPNPTNTDIHLLLNQKGIYYLEVWDIQGKTIFSQTYDNSSTDIQLNQTLINGVYFIHLTNTQTYENYTQKLIIQP